MNISHGPAPPIYEHSPIQRQRSIRLLTLFAADDFEATLGAKLRIHRLDSAPEYIALSYVWGKAEATIPIYIDGHMLKIRKNLSVALKRWRRRQGTFRIWVDAICINQEDNDEKSSQVQLMRFIYQSARMVLIYLEEADGWEEANKVMQHLCEAKKDGILPQYAGGDTHTDFRMIKIPENSWFQRAWTLQECYVSNNCQILHGNTLFGLDILCDTLSDWIYVSVTAEMRDFLHQRGLSSRISLVNFKRTRLRQDQGPLALPLFALLILSNGSQVTKACDRIYALIGISSEAAHPSLQPKYGPNEDDIFIRVAEYAIEEGKGPLLLHWAPNLAKDLPKGSASWIPRWNADETRSAFYTPSHGIDEGIFSASGHSDPAFRSQEIQGSHILSVRGLIFDSIEQVGTCRTDIKEQVGSVEEIVSLITECLVEAHKLLLSRDGYRHFPNESRASVLSRLATCDIDGNDWNLRSPVHNQTAMAMVLDHSIKKLLNGPHSEAYVANIKDIMVDWNPPGFGCDVYLFVAVAIFRLRSQRFITSQGYIGQAPQSVEIGRSKGDKVVLIAGCSVPFILRPQADGRYSVLGDCYLHGIMDGEAWDEGQAVAMEIV
uniref:Heterokaryon incompatibility domain-containing protein n=1 Tax=Bionectria ochroleuca TaxID=29856 RepID=A0A0B7KPA6_BIOOC